MKLDCGVKHLFIILETPVRYRRLQKISVMNLEITIAGTNV